MKVSKRETVDICNYAIDKILEYRRDILKKEVEKFLDRKSWWIFGKPNRELYTYIQAENIVLDSQFGIETRFYMGNQIETANAILDICRFVKQDAIEFDQEFTLFIARWSGKYYTDKHCEERLEDAS